MDIIKQGRRVGNTTRQIDKEIQVLFDTGEVVIWDHAHKEDFNGQYLNMAQQDHTRRIQERLEREYGFKAMVDYQYTFRNKTLKLLNVPPKY